MVRALYRPNREPAQVGISLDIKTRDQIGSFLDASLMRPLWSTNAEWDQSISESLGTISFPERVMIELDMQERQKAAHSFEYDPLR